MKLILLCLLSFFTSFSLISQNLTFQPADGTPGEQLQIHYNPEGTALEKVTEFEVIAYQFTDKGLLATEIPMEGQDGVFSGNLTIPEGSNAISITIASQDGKFKDNNDNLGYLFKMKTADKSTVVPGAYTSIAHAYGRYYRTIGIKKNYEKALNSIKKEFKLHPALLNDEKYLGFYATYAARAKDGEAIAEVKNIIESLKKYSQDSEEAVMLVHTLLNNLGEKAGAGELEKDILTKYPDGEMAKQKLVSSFYKARDLADKLEIFNKLKSKYEADEKLKTTLSNFSRSIAVSYANQEDWANFEKFFSEISDPVQKAGTLNSIAWKMTGESIEAEATNPEKAAALSLQSLELIRSEMDSGASRPLSMTKKQWNRQLDYSYGMYSDTYALLQFQNGNYEEACKYQKIAIVSNKYRDGEMNERFCIFLEKAKGPEKVEKKLQWFIKEGTATSKMKAQYKRVFLANNSLETAYQKHLAALESMADEKKWEELKEKMLDQEAPDFQLVNLEGETVSLSSLKGKVVVLDFWATWCGPCKASFPGMQKAVDKYAENDAVEFLFLDTWERGENKEENASKFMKENGYTFNVVMDNDNKAVEAFQVSGIPTKFVVDKAGKIRFKSVGFGGSDDGLVSELSLMIEMAEEVSTPKTSSRP